MKHVTFGEKALFVGDEAADTLLEYASVIAQSARADTVQLNIVGPDGHTGTATFLLDAGTNLMAESADNDAFSEPDNSQAVKYLREQLAAIDRPATPVPASAEDLQQMGSDFD